MVKPQITVRNMELTTAIKDYVEKKIKKHSDILKKSTHVLVEITEFIPHRGVAKDFSIEINVSMPGSLVRVADKGEDVYELIDKSSDQLARKIKRYEEKRHFWEGGKSLKEIELESSQSEYKEKFPFSDHYQVEFPKISKKMQVNLDPITVEEAIERMELAGTSGWLFNNIETKKISMVYKRLSGGYGLIEPKP